MTTLVSARVFSEHKIRLADEQYRLGNLQGAIEIMSVLTFRDPNTSVNHRKISQVLVAYQIHWKLVQNFTHYNMLNISNPLCSHQMIQSKYKDLVVKLCCDKNKSIAAKSAFMIINTAWKVLSDQERRRDYNIQEGFEGVAIIREDDTNQSKRQGKRHIEIVDGCESDYDSD